MDVIDFWTTDLRIVEIGPRDARLADRLHAIGFRQLCIVDCDAHAQQIVAQRPWLRPLLTVSRRRDRVRQNNADVLILHGWNVLRILRYRDTRHACFVAVSTASLSSLVAAIACGLVQFLVGRFAWPAMISVGRGQSSPAPLVVFRLRRRRPYSATRRFIPHAIGMDGLFERLQAAGIRHVVLRWFESLPELPAGEDLDLLVDDADLAAIREILDSGPGTQAVDLYSVNGAPGADYRKIAYYPPYLADQLLDRAIVYNALCRVPSPSDHFLSLAYHALYHKGTASGLPSTTKARRSQVKPEHDYESILREMARRLGIDVPITLDDLHNYLDTQSWQPPRDTLVKLSRRNAWLKRLVGRSANTPEVALMGVFLLRREALARGGVGRAADLLRQTGFQIVESLILDPRQAERAARNIRGGNWTAGPWPCTGGPPAAAIVVCDGHPLRPNWRQRRKFPLVPNARFLAKEGIRAAFNEGLPPSEHCNAIHSSDTDHEAIDYLRIIVPDRVDEILSRVREFVTPSAESRAAA